jgi:hypothetical protein
VVHRGLNTALQGNFGRCDKNNGEANVSVASIIMHAKYPAV